MNRDLRTIALAVCAFWSLSAGRTIPLGKGGVLQDPPQGRTGPLEKGGAPASPRVAQGVDGPYPTNDWWSSILFPRDPAYPFGKPLFAWPLTFQATSSGLELGAPDPTASVGTEFHYGRIPALTAKVEGLAATEVRALRWTDWTATSRLDDGIRRLDATMGRGMPYAYFESSGGDAVVDCMTDPVVWAGRGTDAVGITVAGNHYGLFAPPGSSWTISGKSFRSNLGGKGHWSVAVLPSADASVLARFRRSAFAFPSDTRLSWTVDPAQGTVSATYRVSATALEGADTTTLMALFRHHWTRSEDVNTDWNYVSPRGTMKVVDGNAFTTVDALPAILPFLPAPEASDAEAIRRELKAAATGELLAPDGDTYWAGKGFLRASSLVDLADQLGETRLRDSLLGAIKAELEAWFSPEAAGVVKAKKLFAYLPEWGALVGYPASYGSDEELNDHHFHWGYFVQAAATVARYDRGWASDWGPVVEELIRDANNPRRGDSRYPFLRHFDVYEGHTWASGHAYFDAGNNNESSSESMNFDASLALWGMATGNDSLRDAGLFLAATEMRAVEQYWWDVDSAVFPARFGNKGIGMVWGDGGAHATWFSGEPECVHGINVLPFTSASLQWTRHPERASSILAEMRAEKTGGAFTQWMDVVMAYRAIADAPGAWTEFDLWDGAGAEGGVPRAWYRRWIALLRDAGALDTTVRADHPAAFALRNGDRRTYLAWNPGTATISARFTDGQILTAAPGAVASVEAPATSVAKRTVPSRPGRVFRTVGTSGFAALGGAAVEVREPDGTLVHRGPASDFRPAPDRIWIVRTR